MGTGAEGNYPASGNNALGTMWYCPDGKKQTIASVAHGNIDFNCNSNSHEHSVSADINGDEGLTKLNSSLDWINTSDGKYDHKNSKLVFTGGAIGDWGASSDDDLGSGPELTYDEAIARDVLAPEGTGSPNPLGPFSLFTGVKGQNLFFDIQNETGTASEFTVNVESDLLAKPWTGKVKVDASHALPLTAQQITVPVADNPKAGDHTVKITVTGPTGEKIDRTYTVNVYTPTADQKAGLSQALKDGSISLPDPVKDQLAKTLDVTPAAGKTVTPAAPSFDGSTVTIPTVEGVEYADKSTGKTLTGKVSLAEGQSLTVVAKAKDGYTIKDGAQTEWTFTHETTNPNPTPTPTPSGSKVPVYRVYNRNSGLHHYTTSQKERDDLVALGWRDEGLSFNAAKQDDTNKNIIPVYREYNPNDGNHNWTTSKKEHDDLVALGWHDEGIGWYVDNTASTIVYRLYNPNSGEHVYTTSKQEYEDVGKAGWHQENIAWKSL